MHQHYPPVYMCCEARDIKSVCIRPLLLSSQTEQTVKVLLEKRYIIGVIKRSWLNSNMRK